MGVWFTVVYLPVAHMVWGGAGSLIGSSWSVLDFAGGTVVHINAGIAGFVACLVTVSYTHLDVYKRQVRCGVLMFSAPARSAMVRDTFKIR